MKKCGSFIKIERTIGIMYVKYYYTLWSINMHVQEGQCSMFSLAKQCRGSFSMQAFPRHTWTDIMHFPSRSLCVFLLSARPHCWGGLGAGAESKAGRTDWYSSQTTGLLLEGPFKPNVNGPLKPVRSSLLNEKPTSECAGRAAKPLPGLESNKVTQSGEVKMSYLLMDTGRLMRTTI